MAIARKDNRSYALRMGECQRKDGRYSYSYTDVEGNRHSVYAKTLQDLRKKERQIIRDLEDGINLKTADRVTLNQLFDKYIEHKYDLKPTTKANYIYMYDRFVRTIPMIDEVYEAFLQEYEVKRCVGYKSETIDEYTNFVFVTYTGGVVSATSVNRAIREIIADYNAQEAQKAPEEGREPLLLPPFSAHSLRHTFCTRFCENESNVKVIQSVVGHADITTTMDIYAEATDEKKQEVMASLQGEL